MTYEKHTILVPAFSMDNESAKIFILTKTFFSNYKKFFGKLIYKKAEEKTKSEIIKNISDIDMRNRLLNNIPKSIVIDGKLISS